MKCVNVQIPGVFGLGLCALLAYLKINNHLDISWLWVFLPVWGPLAVVLAIWVGIVILAIVAAALS